MIEKLKAHPLFADIREDALQALAKRMEERDLAEGEALFHEGDEGDAMYVVAEGEVAIRKDGQTLAVLHDGQMLGEMALFEKESRSADAVATAPTTVYRIGYEEMQSFLLGHPECGARFLFGTSRELSRRLRETSDYLTTVFETGKIVGAGLELTEMATKLLDRLRDDVPEAACASLLLYNPFGETYEIVGRSGTRGMALDAAAELVMAESDRHLFQIDHKGRVLGVALEDDHGEVLGYLLLEKEAATPFTAQEEVVVAAVGQQTGLGILSAYARRDEEDRRRLEQARMRGY